MENTEKITAYLDGILSQSDRLAFEQELERDEALANEVAHHFLALKAAEELAAEQKKKEWMANLASQKPVANTTKTFSFARIGWLAAASVLIFAAVFVYKINQSPDHGSLFAEQVKSREVIGSQTMGGSPVNPEPAQKNAAIEFFNNGELAKARDLFSQLPKSDESDRYLALCYFYEKDYAAAERIFSAQSGLSQSKWYLALIALNKGDVDGCKHWLEGIPSTDGKYYPKAKKVMEKL